MTLPFPSLPTLGVGVSLSLTAEPDPLALAGSSGGPDFIEYAGQLDVEEIAPQTKRIRAAGVPLLFHPAYINFCGSFQNSPAWLAETRRHIEQVNSPWFAQDLAYCFWQEGPGYSAQLGGFIPPLLNRQALELAADRIVEVQNAIRLPLAIEPPPFSFVTGNMPLLSFFGELAERCDCALLLDMGHLVSWEIASGQKLQESLSDLPVERVIEIHIAGGRLQQYDTPLISTNPAVYVDAHESPILQPSWEMLSLLLPLLTNLKAVCYECEGMSAATVLSTLGDLRTRVAQLSSCSTLAEMAKNPQPQCGDAVL